MYPKGRAYRSARELEDALFTFSKAWVTSEKHPEPLISIVTDRKRQIKGELSDIKLDADAVNPAGKKSPAVRANVHLFKKTLTKAFIEDVKSGNRRDVSVGFTYDTVPTTGEWMGEKYDFIQENLLINHVTVGVPVGCMRAPFIGLGCDCVDFETEPSNSDLTQNSAPEAVDSAAKIQVTLQTTQENTCYLIGKLKQIAKW
jgi:hypothetical protein